MPGKRRQLARIGAFVEREENDLQASLVTEAVEQRLQRMDVVRRQRDVGALVAAVAAVERQIVVAERPGVDLHDHPVVEAHRRHLGQHLRAEQLGVLGRPGAADDTAKQRFGLDERQVGCARGRVTMIGRRRAGFAEERAALAVGREIARPALDILAGHFAETRQSGAEVLVLGIDDRIRTICGDHPASPSRGADSCVVRQVVVRPLGRREQFDTKALEQRARAEIRRRHRLAYAVEVEIGRLCIERNVDAKHLGEDMIEPEP